MLNFNRYVNSCLAVILLMGLNESDALLKMEHRTKFCLYTRTSGSKCHKLSMNDPATIKNSTFDAGKQTKIILPGWFDPAYNMKNDIRKAYISALDVNVITFDWVSYTLTARLRVNSVAKFVANFIDWLVAETGISTSSVHVVGFSLGAQVAGVIGERVNAGKLGRITGLDPVERTFDKNSLSGRLDSSDALFVDIIHTSDMGYTDQCGHVDFYPNGGVSTQPGCSILDFGVCSHTRAIKFFIESMTSDKFVARECDNWELFTGGHCDNRTSIVMGEHVDLSSRGKFYLRTAEESPFALG